MRDLHTFLGDYAESHQNPVNQWVHILCVPAIFVSTLGLFWLIPVGQWLGLEGSLAYWVNGGSLLALVCMPFYFRMSAGMTLLMAGWLAASIAAIVLVERSALSLGWTSAAVWLLAWAVQVWGHKVEGKKPSFFEDIQYLMIGPAWIMGFLYRKWGIKY